MPQQTNLNVSPYFDDFDANKNYYKVLFKPGYPVQARELTTLQSILQNQVEKFGQSFFKEGAKVIPGHYAFNNKYNCVQINNNFLGIPVDAYIGQLIGIKIQGVTSGVTALVNNVLLSKESERGTATLYVTYLESSSQNNSSEKFLDGENLIASKSISSGLLGNTSIEAGSPFATTLSSNSSSTGSAFTISEGVYFIRGQFIPIKTETLILDQYTNTPNYRVGFYIDEKIVNADIDETLNDNAQGFSNYAAPGADRLEISVFLFKKPLDDFNDANFIELVALNNGILTAKKTNNSTVVTQEIARRQWNEMGDYYINQYTITPKESLDDQAGNQGIFKPGQLTPNGDVANENIGIYKVSPGKAIIRGYEVENTSATFLEFPKTRTTKTLTNQAFNFNTGTTLKLNRAYGIPVTGIGNTYVLSLRDSRVGDTKIAGFASTISAGKEIGVARIYDYKLESGTYNSNNKNLNQWNVSLFDIQTTCEITLNEPITLSIPTYIQGSNSGASAFLKDAVSNSKLLTVYQKIGQFAVNESFSFNGIDNTRVAVAVTSYSISDVKSVYGKVGIGSTFSADVIQSDFAVVGIATIAASKYFSNSTFLQTTISQDVGVGNTIIFVTDTGGVSVGSSISVGTAYTFANVPVISVGTTSVIIGTAFTSAGTASTTTLSQTYVVGVTTFFATNLSGVAIGSSITVGSRGEVVSAPITGIGSNFVNVGSAFTSGTLLATTLSLSAGVGATIFYLGSTNGLSIGSSMTVGTALTAVPIASVGSTFVTIGAGFTAVSSISAGTAVTFPNISSLLVGTAVTFTKVSAMTAGTIVQFSGIVTTSTVISPNTIFPGNIVSVNNLVTYTDTSQPTNAVIAKVVSVGNTSIEITQIQSVPGITSSVLPSATLQVTDFRILATKVESSSDNTFYSRLSKRDVSSVNLDNSTLIVRKTYTVNISSNKLSTTVLAADNETFLPYTDERYTLVRSDGTYEILTSDKFSFTNGYKELQIYNLGSDNTGAKLTVTISKIKVKSKIKRKNRVNYIIVDRSKNLVSGIGATTNNDGLYYGNYPYGTRVQDEIISLNYPDIIEIHKIYESVDIQNASAPTIIFSTISGSTGKTTDLIIGERIIGQSSGAVALFAERLNDSQISFLPKNDISFKEGETVICEESRIQCVIGTLNSPSKDVSSNFTYLNGQGIAFYDYGTIKRKSNVSAPAGKLKIYFSSGYYDSTDDGDITTIQSYQTFDYKKDTQLINGVKTSDIIDIRPRVSNYSVSEGNRSPLEFYGRIFNQTGNSSANILASNENIVLDYSFYLPRIDRIFLTKDGVFQVKYGTPSEKPERPVMVDDAIEIATATIPAYLYNITDISFDFLQYKRYQMSDIKKLEDRIQNLEYYTSLSLLETNTSNLFIPDSSGLNKFKSGFFVDNFTSLIAQEDSIEIKNSIDLKTGELRASHYTNSIDLQPTKSSTNDDTRFQQPEGINIRRNEDIVTLDYSEKVWLKQKFATRTENVTPFVITFWLGSIELTPSSDTWISTKRLEAKVINAEGNFATTMATATKTLNVDPQTGFAPTLWGSWQTNWTGSYNVTSSQTRSTTTGGDWIGWQGALGYYVPIYGTQTTTTYRDNLTTTIQTGVQTRQGTRTAVVEQIDKTSVGDRVVSRDLIPYMRSRNIQFIAKRLKPSTQMYAFFDTVDVTKFCVPKLLEISMIDGVFQVGETIIGVRRATGLGPKPVDGAVPSIKFRVAQPNHSEGPYNAPTNTYPLNPYTSNSLESTYSSTSTILNVDLFSLANQPDGAYSGWIENNMILIGQTSGAQATLSNVRLISDTRSVLQGSFFIPPDYVGYPRFTSGTKVFTLINNTTNQKATSTTYAEEKFTSSGTIETVQENIIAVRNARVEIQPQSESQAVSRNAGTVVTSTQVISQSSQEVQIGYWDPLAQSFFVDDPTGVFVTKCEVFFKTKDTVNVPVTVQIRTVELGTPTLKILPFSEVVIDPVNVKISNDSSVATTINFKAPVYLEGQKEYALVLMSGSSQYNVFISRVGENDYITQEYISNQPTLGSLFKSQNGSTWEPSQWDDLKFTLYSASFLNSGTLELYNPQLTAGNGQVATLLPNSVTLNSRKVRIGLNTAVSDTTFVPGLTVIQGNSNAYGNYVGSAGSASSNLNIINPGIGYTPSFDMGGSYTYAGVALTSITGTGLNGTANITISNGVAIAATIVNGGTGYQVGDILSVSSLGNSPAGSNIRFSIVSIASTNEIILDGVQGDFNIGVGGTIRFYNQSGIATDLNSTLGGGVIPNRLTVISDGTTVTINHKNHGMYSPQNYVNISKIESDIIPTKLTLDYNTNSTSPLSVENSGNFGIFENVGIGTTNPGYLLIGDEVISYTSTSANQIGGIITRKIDGTISRNYLVGTPVYKYELGGVSLRRINKVHYLQNASSAANAITFDSYNLTIDMSSAYGVGRSDGLSFPKLYFNETMTAGGFNALASQNMPYEIITPMIQNTTVRGTTLTGEVRTVSGKSINGTEIPFTDMGYESISINELNYLNSPRVICSYVNELYKLNNLPGNKSFNMRLLLSTTDSRISPVIDLQRCNAILTSNRVNSAIANYATDKRINLISSDPTACQYISKENVLTNASTSIQVIFDAHINVYSDIRVLYAISPEQNFDPIFIPFPGYDNLFKGQIINPANNNGKPDTNTPVSSSLGFQSATLEFKEYKFTINNLPKFKAYRIKVLLTSTNQAYPPRIKNIKVIALA